MTRAYADFQQNPAATPQSQPIPGREAEMVANNAGGFGFVLDDWERLNRFLILGSEEGTYYVSEHELTEQNAQVVLRCLKEDGPRVVAMARDVNVKNRAPKVDSQLFTLALALKHGDEKTKYAAEAAAPHMLRIGTHVLHLAAYLGKTKRSSAVKRRVLANFFESRDADKLAYQVLKYQSRDGWSMRDLLRFAHPKATGEMHADIYNWICGRGNAYNLPALMRAYGAMNALVAPLYRGHGDVGEQPASPVEKALYGIENGLPREALPTEALADRDVWRALLPQTPSHALIRNLGVLTANGTIGHGVLADTRLVCEKLTDRDALRKARVHPFAILLATLVYKQGHGIRGGKTWTPVPAVLGALEDAYDAAFDNVEPTGKRILVAIDVSGSMHSPCVGTPVSCSTAAAAVAITLARTEPNALVVQFDTAVQRIVPVTRRTGIAALESTRGGGTDVASPVWWALGAEPQTEYMQLRSMYSWVAGAERTGLASSRREFDAFVILTDNETWAGNRHTAEWLDEYRRQVNSKAKLICCAMAANHASVVDPKDPLQLGCAGLDAHIPSIVSEFIRG